MDDVKNLYKTEFDEARLEYNSKQKRDDRKIDDYFTNILNNIKNDLACEIIIELGDKKYWDTKDINYKKKMTNVFIEQVKDLELLVPNFKIASAIIHYDETSPHLHIVGVPIKFNNKNGMKKQVGKSDVFTKESLRKLQDKMRTLCIEEFNQVYSLDSTLKKKQKGRNKDIHVSDMNNYIEMKKQIEKNTENLKQANKKSSEFKQNSKDIKDKINIVEIKGLKPNDIINKVSSYCKEKQIKMGYNDINYLLDKNQNDLDLVISEINKLNIISNNITIDTINTYGSFIPSDDSFDLCDAIVEKKVKEIPSLLNEFIEARKEVIPFIALLAMQYRYIYACKNINKSSDYLMKLFNVSSDYPFIKAKGRTNKYTVQELKEIIINLAKADLDLKSTDKDKYNILKTFISSVIV